MYTIRIEKQKLNFSAAHFITYENECEALHGHNYYTTIEIIGEPDKNNYLVDFKTIKKEMHSLCESLDHRVLLATKNRDLQITQTETQYEVTFHSKKYSFPKEDVVALPIPNTTVEMLSEYLCNKLKENLEKGGYLKNLSSIEVGVEETAGQMASFKAAVAASRR